MRTIVLNLAIPLIAAACVYWLTELYGRALRDPVYFDGWVLSTLLGLQFLYRLKKNHPRWLPGNSILWMRFHIYCGFCLVLVFAIHTRLSLPDSGLEWALWMLFLLVALSGLLGTYLTQTIPIRLEQYDAQMELEGISPLRSALAQRAAMVATQSVGDTGTLAVAQFHAGTLHDFFSAPRNFWSHLRGSRRPLRRLLFEVESMERDLGPDGKGTIDEIRGLVEEKNGLDFQHAHRLALKAWLFVHVPASTALIVMTILHVTVVYAYSTAAQ